MKKLAELEPKKKLAPRCTKRAAGETLGSIAQVYVDRRST